MSTPWRPGFDHEPGPAVRAVALEGSDPRHLRWERCKDGWGARGITVTHARYTPAKPWWAIGQPAAGHPRCRRCGGEYLLAAVDVTASLGEQCVACRGFGCFRCGWNGRD